MTLGRLCLLLLTTHRARPFVLGPRQPTPRPLRAEADGRLSDIKASEAQLRWQLAQVQREKAEVLATRRLKIGIVGFGKFGQFLAKKFADYDHEIAALSHSDRSAEARALGAEACHRLGDATDVLKFFERDLDVVVLAVSIVSFDDTLARLREGLVAHPHTLIVDVLSVKEHARDALLRRLPAETSVLCTHPMFGPESGRHGWQDLAFVYDRVRVTKESSDPCERFLSIFESAGCRMVEMTCRQHDIYAANSQFLTHLVGRMLGSIGDLHPTPIDTRGFESVLQIVHTTCDDSFDLFYGLYRYNAHSKSTLLCLRLCGN
mmetsp:Transcript_25951/g.79809  ORF Transcript_25951/g.79809 Transcript_25951/m.79809 type:complete len:319 (-) Transcript_25951:403-1359(-)